MSVLVWICTNRQHDRLVELGWFCLLKILPGKRSLYLQQQLNFAVLGNVLAILILSAMCWHVIVESDVVCEGDDVLISYPRVQNRAFRRFLIKLSKPSDHSRSSDDEFLVGVEDNPGPKPQVQKRAQNRKKQVNQASDNANEIAKLQADLDYEKQRHKEAELKHFEPLSQINEETAFMIAQQKHRQAQIDSSNGDNSITFPDLQGPPIVQGELAQGIKRPSIFISDVPSDRVHGWTLFLRRALYIFLAYVLFHYLASAVTAVWMSALFDLEQDLYFEVLNKGYLSYIVFACSLIPPTAFLLALYLAANRPQSTRLVGVAISQEELKVDDRPEFDRGDRLAPQKFVDYKLYVESRYGDSYLYHDLRKDLDLPDFWFDSLGSASRLKILHLNIGLMASALNRKTLGLRGGGAKDAARIERSFRLVSSNAAYQEDYRRLLDDGTSSYADMQLFAGTVLSGDPTINPTAFC